MGSSSCDGGVVGEWKVELFLSGQLVDASSGTTWFCGGKGREARVSLFKHRRRGLRDGDVILHKSGGTPRDDS